MPRQNVLLVVRAVISRRDSKILLVQRVEKSRHNPNLWEVPGGRIVSGEPVGVALKREVKEETGLLVSPRHSQPLTFVSYMEGEALYVVLFFRCPSARGEKVRISVEHQAFRWEKVEDALELPLTPTARELVEFLLE